MTYGERSEPLATDHSRVAMFLRPILVALVASIAGVSHAAEPDEIVAQLEALLARSGNLHATFRQVMLNEEGAILQSAEGELWMTRPDRFRWDYAAPFDQLIVSDGARVWVYDRELAQVTVRDAAEAISGSPAALLSGEGALSEDFEVLDAGEADEVMSVTLAPRLSDTDFLRVTVVFDARELRALQLEDALGQITHVDLMDVEQGGEIDPALYEFTAPEGVDVLGMDAGGTGDDDG